MPVQLRPQSLDSDDIQTLLQLVTVTSPSAHAGTTPGESLILQGGVSNPNISSVVPSASHERLLPVVFIKQSQLNQFCLGIIGNHKKAFCLKAPEDCTVCSHMSDKFSPTTDCFYVCRSSDKTSAWCDTFIQEKKVKLKHDTVDMTVEKPLLEWRAMFDMLDKTQVPPPSLNSLDQAIEAITKTNITSFLKTPKKVTASSDLIMRPKSPSDKGPAAHFAGLKATFKVLGLSFNENLANLSPKEPSKSLLEDMQDDLGAIITYLSNEAQNFEIVSDVAEDLEVLSRNIVNIKQTLGSTIHNPYPTVWSGLEELWSLHDAFDIEDLSEAVIKLKFESETTWNTVKLHVSYWEAMAKNWLPKISLLEKAQADLKSTFENQTRSQPSNPKSSIMDQFLRTNQSSNQQGTAPNMSSIHNATSHSSPDVKDLQLTIIDLKNQISVMKDQIKSMVDGQSDLATPLISNNQIQNSSNFEHAGVRYRQYYFRDPAEVESWMRSHMTHPSHGLFVDLVSFSEFFGGERYVERNTTLSEMYMSSKIGYSTLADSIVASSFQNVLPGAYGRPVSSSNNDDYESTVQSELPGLPSYAKWDNRDGRHGRRFWIREETRKTEQQLDGCIRSQLAGPAQILAKDMLMDSFAMSDALYNFIISSYEDTMNAGKFDNKQAWTLTCSFVKRIFQELSYERVMARDGIHVDEPWSTSANFLFATMKAHRVMSEFMKLSIKDHPSISSEMVKFVCYSQPTADTSDLLTRLHGVESLQRADQSNISKLESRTKKLESWKSDAEKLLKKLKEKTGV